MHWEWFYGWHTTFAHYFPKYLLEEDPCINSFFATNVPYNFPTDVVWDDTYKVSGEGAQRSSCSMFSPGAGLQGVRVQAERVEGHQPWRSPALLRSVLRDVNIVLSIALNSFLLPYTWKQVTTI